MKQLFEYYTSAFAKPTAIKLGLDVVSKIDALLGCPSRQFEVVHIAGTNGKGSVATKIAASLHLSGKRVGLYTSPHLLSFCERIWANGAYITEVQMTRYICQVEEAAKQIGVRATFFELLTLIAFLHFAKEKVEIAVIEVGLGGRLDATNIVQPKLSIITSIGLDHQEHLGHSIEEIAYEKAGIIKEGCPVIVGGEPKSFFQKIAEQKRAPFFAVKAHADVELHNQAIASLALDQLSCDKKALLVRPPARFEILQKEPLVVVDVAHNEAALEALFAKMKEPFTVVAAFSCAKKAPPMTKLMRERAEHVYLTKANHERAVAPPNIEGCSYVRDVHTALQVAKGPLLVTGTFFMMEEAYSFFGVKELKGPFYD